MTHPRFWKHVHLASELFMEPTNAHTSRPHIREVVCSGSMPYTKVTTHGPYSFYTLPRTNFTTSYTTHIWTIKRTKYTKKFPSSHPHARSVTPSPKSVLISGLNHHRQNVHKIANWRLILFGPTKTYPSHRQHRYALSKCHSDPVEAGGGHLNSLSRRIGLRVQ